MNLPGFTAEVALSMAGRGYWQRVNALPDSNRTSVFMALQVNQDRWFQCCCGSGANQRCTGHIPCPAGCSHSCRCGPGYVLGHCRCGTVGGGRLEGIEGIGGIGGEIGGGVGVIT